MALRCAMTNSHIGVSMISKMMHAIRLHTADGPAGLVYEQIAIPQPKAGEALIRVHAAAITRDELDWPVNRIPAVPSYEFSGVVSAMGRDSDGVIIGEPVYPLRAFDPQPAAPHDFLASHQF